MPLSELDPLFAAQKVRLFDTYALGPFLIWYAMKSKGLGKWSRRTLFTAGIYTVIYNWKSYRAAEATLEAKAALILQGAQYVQR